MTMVTHAFTKTDSAANEWAIDDDVVRLREWGTDTVHGLPQPPVDECTVGAAETCGIQLDDPSRLMSRLHARLVRDETKWVLRDGDSKNGVRLDGARRSEIVLEPGLEIGIGGITLIAESALSIALRGFLARLLGWGSDRVEIVDQALRAVRLAAAGRSALVLCSDGDLVPTASSIHARARGTDRPFIVCDPRRQRGKATVRSAESYSRGMEALAVAAGGSLCVRTRRLPLDFHDVVEALRAPNTRVQLIVCADALEDCEVYGMTPIVIPPVASRAAELDRIIREYAEDAMMELATPRSGFQDADLAWVREHAGTSLPEIEKATRRLVALRASRSLSKAAMRLGMAPISLSRWIGRHHMPMKIAP
jgi:pSer/pThr/pTyr-binding forkhead associated (FHA) protein